MKAFFSRLGRPVFAAVLALSMLFSVAVPAFATIDDLDGDKDGKINYVSIGDSMTNGYGFDGYRQGHGANFFTGEGVYGNAAYPNLFEAYLEGLGYEVEHTKLAVSALRAEDLNYLLGGREKPTDGWFVNVNNYAGCDDDAKLSEFYVNAVENADIITLGIGNASFGAFLVDYVTRVLQIMRDEPTGDDIVDLEDAIAELDEETKRTVLDVYDELLLNLTEYVPAEIAEKYELEAICDAIAYICAGFVINYAQVIERITELNPDVEIILVGMMNTTYGMNVTADGISPIPIGDIMDEVFGAMNAYVAALPVVLRADGKCEEVEFYYAELANPKFIVQEFDDLYQNGWQNHNGLSADIVRDRNIDAYNAILRTAASGALGYDLPKIGLSNVKAYEADYVAYASTNASRAVSVAVYLAIEESTANSVDTLDIPVTGLMKIADGLSGVFDGLELGIDTTDPTSLEAAREKLAVYLTSDPELRGMSKVYALFSVGDGMSVHPTPEAHSDLAGIIIKAYEEGHTASDATVENLIKYANKAWNVTKLAYKTGYREALENGYIDIAVDALDRVYVEIDAIYGIIDSLEISDELKAELSEEIDLAKVIIEDIREMLAKDEIDELDKEALDALCDLLEKLGDALYNVADIAGVAGADLYELWMTEGKPAVEAALEKIADAAQKFIENKLDRAQKLLFETIAKLEAQIRARIDAMLGELEGKYDEKLSALLDRINELKAEIGEIIDTVNALKAELEEKVEMLSKLVNELAKKYEEIKDAASEVIVKLEAAIEKVKAEIENIREQLAQLRKTLETLYKDAKIWAAQAKVVFGEIAEYLESEEFAAIVEAAKKAIEDFDENAEKLEKHYEFMKLVLKMTVEGAKNGSFSVDEDSFYVGLGDSAAADESYVDVLAELLGVDYENLAEDGQTLEKALELIAENADLIEKADIITIGYSNTGISTYMFEQMNAKISGKKTESPDWNALLGNRAKYMVKAFEKLHEMLVEQGLDIDFMGVNLAELLTLGVESYVYAYTERTLVYPEIISAVEKIAPEALVILVGSYNDLEGVVLELGETKVDIGAYVEYAVEASNLEALLCAIRAQSNVVYVEAPEVETVFEADIAAGEYSSLNLMTYFNAILNGDLDPSENGHAYIAEKILAALDVHRHVYDNCDDTVCNDCGHEREPVAHSFGDWVTVKPATEDEEGTKERTCKLCGHKETGKIEKLPPMTTAPSDLVTTPVEPPLSTAPSDPPVEESTPADTTLLEILNPDSTTPNVNNTKENTSVGMPVGAVVGISVAAVSIVAAVGFCLYWFIFKKKIS